jgi:hypothetical protein
MICPSSFKASSWEAKDCRWLGAPGLVIVQSGQPYSVIDYTGAVGGNFYSIYDGITNPIVPLNLANGCTAQSALTGANGVTPGQPALNASCFTLPLLTPNAANGVPSVDTFETNFTTGQRNIFRQTWQKNADISLLKTTEINERVTLKFSFDVFNLTNTPSFDIPIDNVSQNANYGQYPQAGQGTAPTPQQCASNGGNIFVGSDFYNCPGGLGQVTKVIGSNRQIQMSLAVTF